MARLRPIAHWAQGARQGRPSRARLRAGPGNLRQRAVSKPRIGAVFPKLTSGPTASSNDELTRPATRQRLQPVKTEEAWEPGCKHKHRKGLRRTLRMRMRTAKGGAGESEALSYLGPFHLPLCCGVYSSWVLHLSLLFFIKSSRS